jgi:ASC-1-like (ASCH) protein
MKEIDIKKILPNANNIDQAIEIYNQFPHKEYENYKNAANHYGVLRIKFTII